MTLDDIKRRIDRDVYDRPLAAILTNIVEIIGDRLVTAQGLVLEAEARAQAVVDRMEEDAACAEAQRARDALAAYDATPIAAFDLVIRDAVLEEAAKAAEDVRRADWSGETDEWCEGTRDAASAIRALRTSLAPEPVGEEHPAAIVCADEIAEEIEGLTHDPLSAGRHLLSCYHITRKPKEG